MTAAETAKLVAILMTAYPSAKAGSDTSELYEALLADLDFEAAKRAVAEIIQTSKFFPTIAEIREVAEKHKPPPPRLPIKQTGPVWREMTQEEVNRHYGWTGSSMDAESFERWKAHQRRKSEPAPVIEVPLDVEAMKRRAAADRLRLQAWAIENGDADPEEKAS